MEEKADMDFYQPLTKNFLWETIKQNPEKMYEFYDLSQSYPHTEIQFDVIRWKIDLIKFALSNYEKYGPYLGKLIEQDLLARKVVQQVAAKEPRLFFGRPNKEAIRKYEAAVFALKKPIEKTASVVNVPRPRLG